MKIAFVWILEFGRFPDIYEYSTILAGMGHQIHYIGTSIIEKQYNENGVCVHHVKREENKWDFLKKMSSAIDDIQPDIVHVFHFRGSGLLPLFSHTKNKKWIIDVRTLHVGKNGSFFLHRLKDRLTYIETFAYKNILALTPRVKKYLQPNKVKMYTIPLGASYSKLNSSNRAKTREEIRKSLGISESTKVLLYAGSFDQGRKLENMINAFAAINNPDRDIKFLLVGGDPSDPYFKFLVNYVKSKSLENECLFVERTMYPEVLKYFAASDIGIVFVPINTPHRYQPPTKLIEYMMGDILSVANATEANSELILDKENGILCGNDINDLASGLLEALDILPKAAPILENAKRTVRERDWENLVKTCLIPYYDLVH